MEFKRIKDYTKEECKELYKDCSCRAEFTKKHYGAYRACKENGWLDEVCPLLCMLDKPKTLEEAIEKAKEYRNRSELHEKNPSLFRYLKKNGWIDKIDNLISKIDEASKIHYIYAYEFTEYNTAYIGRTIDIKKRHLDHLRINKSAISKFMKENGLGNVELPKIIYEKLTARESQEKEAEQIEVYKANGWNVLNKAKAGSLGSLDRKYSKQMCIEKAKQFEYKCDFRKAYEKLYIKAYNKGWLKEFYWLKNLHNESKDYTYEECKEFSKTCSSRREWQHKNYTMYIQCLNNGWMDDFIENKIKHYIVIEYDLDGNFIKQHDSVHKEYGKRSDLINQVSRRGNHYAYGRLWYKLDDVLGDNGEALKKIDITIDTTPYKAVVQYDENGNFLNEYATIMELNYDNTYIIKSCKEEYITAYGYIWRFKEDVTNNDGSIIQHVEQRLHKRYRPILLYNIDGNFIKEFITYSDAHKNGYSKRKINWTADGHCGDKPFTKYGQIWVRKEDLILLYGNTPEKIDVSDLEAKLRQIKEFKERQHHKTKINKLK